MPSQPKNPTPPQGKDPRVSFSAQEWASSSPPVDQEPPKERRSVKSPVAVVDRTRATTPPPPAPKQPSPHLNPPRRRKKVPRSLGVTIYRNLYFLGIQCCRLLIRWRRTIGTVGTTVLGKLQMRKATRKIRLERRKADFIRSFAQPFAQIKRQQRQFAERLEDAKVQGRGAVIRTVAYSFRHTFHNVWKITCLLLNFVAPLLAVGAFIGGVTYARSLHFGLQVEYAGQPIGYIADETVFDQAETIITQRLANEEYIRPENSVPHFTLTVVEPQQLTDAETLANQIISVSGNEITEASGIYINDRFMGAVEDGTALLNYLDRVRNKYSTGTEGEEITFRKRIRLDKGLFPVSSVVTLEDLIPTLESNESEQKNYTVEAGDTPIVIAAKVGMELIDLVALNPDMLETLLPGQQLIANAAVPYLGVRITRVEEYEEEIPYGTEKIEANSYPKGWSQTVSAGVPGTQDVVAKITYEDNLEVGRSIISETVTKKPVDQVIKVGTQAPLQTLPKSSGGGTVTNAGGWIWPVDGGYISMPIWGYWNHTGNDIAASYGTNVRAAAAGTVIKSTYYGAYGNHIMIDHGNGVVTLYAHMSQRYVGVGTYVEQGTIIGAIGATGNAYGNHLHIEFRVGGQYLDGRKYFGYSR